MKPLLFLLTLFLGAGVFAQNKPAKPDDSAKKPTCYNEWHSLFKERGASPVADGSHEVIISITNAYGYNECFMGKIDVASGKLAGKLQIQKVDGSFQEFDRKVSTIYQGADGVLRENLRDVSNGMSEIFTLSDGDKIRLFFYKSLASKPQANKKSPSPAALIKN